MTLAYDVADASHEPRRRSARLIPMSRPALSEEIANIWAKLREEDGDLGVPQAAFIERVESIVRARSEDAPGQARAALDQLVIRDLHLAMGCLRGNNAAVRLFLRRFEAYIKKLSHQHAPSRAVGEEVEQELLATLFTPKRASDPTSARLHSYRGLGSMQGWLRVTARRLVLDMIRSPTFKDTAQHDVDDRVAPIASDDDPTDDTLALRDAVAQIKPLLLACVMDLADDDRNVLRLYYSEGLVLREIASKRGVDITSVHRKLVGIRKRLWSALKTRVQQQLSLDENDLKSMIRELADDFSLAEMFPAGAAILAAAALMAAELAVPAF